MSTSPGRAARRAYGVGPFRGNATFHRRRFTLVERLVLLAIVGVIVAVALPSRAFTIDFYECALCRTARRVEAFADRPYRDETFETEVSRVVCRSEVGAHEHRWMHVGDHIECDLFGWARSWAYLNQPPLFNIPRPTSVEMFRRCEARGQVPWLFERLTVIDELWNTRDDAKRDRAEALTRELRDEILDWPVPPRPYPVLTYPAASP